MAHYTHSLVCVLGYTPWQIRKQSVGVSLSSLDLETGLTLFNLPLSPSIGAEHVEVAGGAEVIRLGSEYLSPA